MRRPRFPGLSSVYYTRGRLSISIAKTGPSACRRTATEGKKEPPRHILPGGSFSCVTNIQKGKRISVSYLEAINASTCA